MAVNLESERQRWQLYIDTASSAASEAKRVLNDLNAAQFDETGAVRVPEGHRAHLARARRLAAALGPLCADLVADWRHEDVRSA